MDSKYNVPVIPQNLYKHETIVEIAEVLDHLSNVCEGIFAQINRRLERNREKLSSISQRVDLVNLKINNLRGAKTATQVFSSNKYPASDIYEKYSSVFEDAPLIELKRNLVKLKNPSVMQEPLEKLQFYHVNIQKNSEHRLEGLGDKTPRSTKFVNDLLLYNSGKNLYTNFVISHALSAPLQIGIDEECESEIGAAPHSISERSTQRKAHKQSYFYTPQIGNVPALNVPLDLPDLPGIANDLHYENDIDSSIAPSADITPSILELDFDTNQKLPTIDLEEEESQEIPNISVADLLPMPEVKEIELPVTEQPNKQVILKIKEDKEKHLENPVNTTVHAQGPDLRSSLMEAIRNAGGSSKAKLKSVNENNEKTAKASQGGDLMADLHNKLFMRRKGISGAKQSQEGSVEPETALSRISSMIPPPETKNEPDSTSNDEEWDE